jgi:hypothetical protein
MSNRLDFLFGSVNDEQTRVEREWLMKFRDKWIKDE